MKPGVDQPDIAALEHACLTAVPAQRVAFDGSFVVRAFLGGTGRANAASSLSPEVDPELAARIARIERRYEALGLPVRFRSTPLDPPGMAELLRARGYVMKDETIIFWHQFRVLHVRIWLCAFYQRLMRIGWR